jgi:molybdopterin molybdotransferase
VAQHREAVLRALGAPRTETVPLDWTTVGQVLAEPLVALADLPRFDSSAMDGFALRPAFPEQRVFRVVGDVAAGSAASVRLRPGESARVMTGAPVPEGTVLVRPVEATDASPTGEAAAEITVTGEFEEGRHVRRAGEEIRRGAVLAPVGAVVSPGVLAVARSAGCASAVLCLRPRVAVVATGAELARPGEDPGSAGVFESNAHMVASLATCAGAVVTRVTTCPDDPTLLTGLLTELDADPDVDLVITTGGVSQGAHEVVRQVCEPLPGFYFGRVAMQPGAPQGLGTFGSTPVICLPGTPSGAFVSFHAFVGPAVRASSGHREVSPRRVSYAGPDLVPRRGGVRFVPGAWVREGRSVTIAAGDHLGAIANATVLIELDDLRPNLVDGDDVRVHDCFTATAHR